MGGRVAILLALVLCCSCSVGTEIPLNRIWALRMPGTKNVEDLEPEHHGKNLRSLPQEEQLEHLTQSLTYQIPQVINDKPQDQPIGPGFVVVGTGRVALENVKVALDTAPPKTLPANEDLTLFFYSRFLGSYMHVKRVTRNVNNIVIDFVFVSHGLKTMTNHFALIPLGKLPVGDYHVEIVPSIANRSGVVHDPARAASFAKEYVCQPFSFSVE
jgi:hypothetical protein